MQDKITDRMRTVSTEIQEMVNGGAPLHSDAVVKKSMEFDELVMKHYRRKQGRAKKLEKKLRTLRRKP